MGGALAVSGLSFVMTLAGGALPLMRRSLSRESLWRFLSLGSGVLLSATFMEILPEALGGPSGAAGGWGLVLAFLLLFGLEHFAMMHSCQEVLEDCHVHDVGYAAMGAMAVHSLLDGINLAIAFAAGGAAGSTVGLALVLHKFADGLTLTTLFSHAGVPRQRAAAALAALALATPVGCLLGARWVAASGASTSLLLGFAAGCFLYIASADILPRLHREKDRVCLALFSFGLLSVAGLRSLAP